MLRAVERMKAFLLPSIAKDAPAPGELEEDTQRLNDVLREMRALVQAIREDADRMEQRKSGRK